jgi:hypothetical protein
MADPLRCVIVGPGRTRNGLGPFFTRYLAEAGVDVCGGVGRDEERSRIACAGLSRWTGADVSPFTDLESAIRETGATLVVVASPSVSHACHLETAAAHGVDVLCEKPLVGAEIQGACEHVDRLVGSFVERGRFLVENCQWPMVLPAFHELAGRRPAVPSRVAMRLSPSGQGRAMLEDSASHLISVLQELVGDALAWELAEVAIDVESADVADLRCTGVHSAGSFEVTFHLRRVESQPRPAWLAVDGFRADRVIDPSDYSMRLRAADGQEIPLADPLRTLVYGFVADLRARDLDRLRTHADRIRARARLYAAILAAWPTPR